VLPEFPHVTIERVDVLEHPDALRGRGIRRVPVLLHGDRTLSGFFLTRRQIRRFLKNLPVPG